MDANYPTLPGSDEPFGGSDMARSFAVYQPTGPKQEPTKKKRLGLYAELETAAETQEVSLDLSAESLAQLDRLLLDNSWVPEVELLTPLAIYLGDTVCSLFETAYWIIGSNGYPHVHIPPSTEWDVIYYVKHRAPEGKAFLVSGLEHFRSQE